jgi:hypothetical protein
MRTSDQWASYAVANLSETDGAIYVYVRYNYTTQEGYNCALYYNGELQV